MAQTDWLAASIGEDYDARTPVQSALANSGNALTDNNTYVTNTTPLDKTDKSNRGIVRDFAGADALPGGAVVTAIEIRFQAHYAIVTGTPFPRLEVQFRPSVALGLSADLVASTIVDTAAGGALITLPAGGTTALYGFTSTQITKDVCTGAEFGVIYSFIEASGSGTHQANYWLDFIEIRLTYDSDVAITLPSAAANGYAKGWGGTKELEIAKPLTQANYTGAGGFVWNSGTSKWDATGNGNPTLTGDLLAIVDAGDTYVMTNTYSNRSGSVWQIGTALCDTSLYLNFYAIASDGPLTAEGTAFKKGANASSVLAFVNAVYGAPFTLQTHSIKEKVGWGTIVTQQNVVVDVPVGAVAITGHVPTITTPQLITVPAGAVTIAGLAPTVATPLAITVPVGAVTIAAFAPTVATPLAITVPVGAVTIAAFAPTVSTPLAITVPVGAVTIAAFAATVDTPLAITVPVGAVTIAAFAATATASDQQVVQVPVGAAAFTRFDPTVTASDNQIVAVPVGAVTTSGFAPTVTATDHKIVEATVGAAAFTGLVPTVTVLDNQTVSPTVGAVVLVGLAPRIVISYVVPILSAIAITSAPETTLIPKGAVNF